MSYEHDYYIPETTKFLPFLCHSTFTLPLICQMMTYLRIIVIIIIIYSENIF